VTDIGLLHPPGSPLSDENEIVVPEPSAYEQPVALAAARSEFDVVDRRDGDYGLVEPAGSAGTALLRPGIDKGGASIRA
jgi:hypothetical protein